MCGSETCVHAKRLFNQGPEEARKFASGVSKSSSSFKRLLQLEDRRGINFDRSKMVPLRPVILEETMGITKTEDALSDSSPKPNDREQAACKRATLACLICKESIVCL